MKNPFAVRSLLIALVFVVGFASHSIFRSFSFRPTADSYTTPSEQEEEIAKLANRIAELQIAEAELENELSRLNHATPKVEIESSQQKVTRTGQANALSEGTGFSEERFREMMKRQAKQQLDIFAARLDLNDYQRGKLEEIMLLPMMQLPTRFGPDGPQSASDISTPMITQRDIDDLSAEILDPDQLSEYAEMRAQEDALRSAMMATARLSQIAPQLGLREDQKDEVFSIYYEQAMEMTSGMMDPQAIEEARAQADEQIVELLDAEQREVFRTLRENTAFGNFTFIAR